MIIARISDGVVVNIEVADESWVRAARAATPDPKSHPVTFVEIHETDEAPNIAHIGYGYDPARGFEQPPVAMTDDQDPPDYLYDAAGEIMFYPSEWRQPKGITE